MGPDRTPRPPVSEVPEPGLDEIRRRHPGWDVTEVFGGYQATPAGTVVIRAGWLSTLDERLDEAGG